MNRHPDNYLDLTHAEVLELQEHLGKNQRSLNYRLISLFVMLCGVLINIIIAGALEFAVLFFVSAFMMVIGNSDYRSLLKIYRHSQLLKQDLIHRQKIACSGVVVKKLRYFSPVTYAVFLRFDDLKLNVTQEKYFSLKEGDRVIYGLSRFAQVELIASPEFSP